MKCPHCLDSFHAQMTKIDIGEDRYAHWILNWQACPACHRAIIQLISFPQGQRLVMERFVEPKNIARAPVPKEVPAELSNDYKEACLTLADSPKASAALSRRCLQAVLENKAGIKTGNLSSEIDQVIASSQLPAYLSKSIDAIRNVGNFAAHPTKSTNTGQIVDVEAGEAEWLLDVLEGLFDFYYIQPAILAAKQDALNQKLKDAGKPAMKQ